jgi:hypothetical protein
MDVLENTIRGIIKPIAAGYYFDTHTVIALLIQQYNDVYLLNTGNYTATDQYHSKISTLIGSNSDMVDSVGKAYSKNVLDNFSECNIWIRKN